MTGAELKTVREGIGYDLVCMAIALDNMPYRTYQDYEGERRKIPEKVAAKVREVVKRDQAVMKQILKKMDKLISKRFPEGIPSEIF